MSFEITPMSKAQGLTSYPLQAIYVYPVPLVTFSASNIDVTFRFGLGVLQGH